MQKNDAGLLHDSEIVRFRKALRVVERAVGGQIKEETTCCGVTSAQCHTLLEIEDKGKAGISEIADILSLDKSTLSRTIDSLVAAEMVDRVENPADRRYSLISLTQKGKDTVSTINRLCNKSYRDLFSFVPEDKQKDIIESIAVLSNAMQKYRAAESCCSNQNITS